MAPGRIVQQCGAGFLSLKHRFHAEVPPKFHRNLTHGKCFWSGQIQDGRRLLAKLEGAKSGRVRLALPYDVCVTHIHIDGPPLENLPANVH